MARLARMAAGAALVCAVQVSQAQVVRIEPRLSASVTASDNITMAEQAGARKDLALAVSAAVALRRQGAGMSLDADIGVDGLAYARGSAPARLLPRAQVRWDAELVEHWLQLAGGLQVAQSASDPLGVRAAGLGTLNRVTSTRVNIAPTLQRALGPSLSVLARSDLSSTTRSGNFGAGDARRDFTAQEHLLSLEQKPQPLGWSLEANHSSTRYQGDAEAALTETVVQGVLNWAPSPDWQLGVSAAREQAQFALSERHHSALGLRMRWTPTERTLLAAEVEDRYFGRSWDLQASHRMPGLVLGLRWVRRASAQPVSQLLGAAGSVTGQLDAMLSTRLPDAAERAAAVQQLLRQLGLSGSSETAVELYADAARVEQGLELSALFMGRLTSVQLLATARRMAELRDPSDPLAPGGGELANSRQLSLDFQVRRRIGALTQAELSASHSRVQALAAGAVASQSSMLRVGANRRLSPSTDASASLRFQRLSSRTLLTPAKELAATLGLSHRF